MGISRTKQGSVTSLKARYNDDFYFRNNGSNKYLRTSVPVAEINSLNSFCISFTCYLSQSNVNNCIISRTGAGGITVFLNRVSNSQFVVYIINHATGGIEQSLSINKGYSLNASLCFVVNFNTSTNTFNIYVNSELVGSILRNTSNPFTSTSSLKIGQTTSGAYSLNGGLRDLQIFNRELTQEEISHVYYKNNIPTSIHANCQFHLPLNHIARVDGANRTFLDVVSNYDYAKVSPIAPKHATMTGWTDDELGLNIGTSTFTAYADFYTKTLGANFSGGGNSIIYKGKELRKYGLQFGTGKFLEVLNFSPTSERGYTILCVVAKDTNTAWGSQQSFFSKIDNATFAQNRIEVFGRGSGLKEISSNVGNISINLLESQIGNHDFSKPFLFSKRFTKNGANVITNTGKNKRVLDFNTKSIVKDNTFPTPNIGFEDILDTNPGTRTYIGRQRTGNTTPLQGKILYLAIYKGILDDSEIKRLYNNGLYRNAWDISPITGSELVLFPDFNNPFNDAGTLKIPDLSPSNYTIIASGWTDLTALLNARVITNTLM